MPFTKPARSAHNQSTGFALFELLLALTLMAGSMMALHSIYLKLLAKQIHLQKVQDDSIKNHNQYELSIARNRIEHHKHSDQNIETASRSKKQRQPLNAQRKQGL